MQRLNESASWLSDVSISSDEDEEDEKRKAIYAEALQNPMCLAKAINESATWLDTDQLDGSQEEGQLGVCDMQESGTNRWEQPVIGTTGLEENSNRRIVRSCSY